MRFTGINIKGFGVRYRLGGQAISLAKRGLKGRLFFSTP